MISLLAMLFCVVLALICAGIHARASPTCVVTLTLITWSAYVGITQADRYAVDARGEGPRTAIR